MYVVGDHIKKEYLNNLVDQLIALPHETEWVEFKCNKATPEEIGEYISALSNSSALHGKSCGYILWGIEDISHSIVGTSFRPRKQKQGNQELESWLLGLLDPKIEFSIHEEEFNGHYIVLFEIQAALTKPVRFKGVEYIRVGSSKRKLLDFPEKERILWQFFNNTSFEKGIAKERVSSHEVCLCLITLATLNSFNSHYQITKIQFFTVYCPKASSKAQENIIIFPILELFCLQEI